MKFFIPTYKRSQVIDKYTLKCLREYGINKDDIYLFVNAEDAPNYEIHKNLANILISPSGIGATRKFIQSYAIENNIDHGFILDDDLQVLLCKSEKAPKGWWHNRYIREATEAQRYLKQMEEDCLTGSEILVGLTPRRVMHLDKPRKFSNGHPYGFYWLNFKKLKEMDVWYDASMKHFEDYDITFKLLAKNYNTKLYRDLGFSSFVIGTLQGGCYDNYQTQDLISLGLALAEKYNVKFVQREIINKSGQNNLSFKIRWNKPNDKPKEDFLSSIAGKVIDDEQAK